MPRSALGGHFERIIHHSTHFGLRVLGNPHSVMTLARCASPTCTFILVLESLNLANASSVIFEDEEIRWS